MVDGKINDNKNKCNYLTYIKSNYHPRMVDDKINDSKKKM